MSARHEKYQRLIDYCKTLPPTPTAVVHPCDRSSIEGAVQAAKLGLIAPILVGPRAKIEAAAKAADVDISSFPLVDVPHSHAAAEAGVQLVREGKAEALMKGSLHTDELMGAVVRRQTGLRTARRVSHCFVMDVPSYEPALITTDTAVHIAPTLAETADILQKEIDLARALNVDEVRVAILSAMETVNPNVPSTVDGRCAKMVDRHQITGALVDGPLALDNAIQPRGREDQEDRLAGGGRANVLMVPDLEPATCWPRACRSSPGPMPPASSSARACRSSSPAAPTR
jgi:phosphate acetyltransferase